MSEQVSTSWRIPGVVAQLPWHAGDGYSWGGDIVVSFGNIALNLGSSHQHNEEQRRLSLAHLIAAAPTMLEALQAVNLSAVSLDPETFEYGFRVEWPAIQKVMAAIAKATGTSNG